RGLEGVQRVTRERGGSWKVVADRDVRAAAARQIISKGGALTRLTATTPGLQEAYHRYFGADAPRPQSSPRGKPPAALLRLTCRAEMVRNAMAWRERIGPVGDLSAAGLARFLRAALDFRQWRIREAERHLRAGRVEAAEAALRQVLARQP